jgi:tetratricopeptide (TPR) repeat protein
MTGTNLAQDAQEIERRATNGEDWEKAAETWDRAGDHERSSKAWASAAKEYQKVAEGTSGQDERTRSTREWYLRHAAAAWEKAEEPKKAASIRANIRASSDKAEDWRSAADTAEKSGDWEAAALRWEWAAARPTAVYPIDPELLDPRARAAVAWEKAGSWSKSAVAWERTAGAIQLKGDGESGLPEGWRQRAECWARAAVAWENAAVAGSKEAWSLAARAWRRTSNAWESGRFFAETISSLEKEGAAWEHARCPSNQVIALERANAWKKAAPMLATAETHPEPPKPSRRY